MYCNPETIVKKAVAPIKKSIKYGMGGEILEKSAQITVQSWEKVVNLPDIEGLIFNEREVKKKMRIPKLMIMSRLITSTANQPGKIFKIANVINEEAERSLSAAGSRYDPNSVRWCKSRASNPSTASLTAAAIKSTNAQK